MSQEPLPCRLLNQKKKFETSSSTAFSYIVLSIEKKNLTTSETAIKYITFIGWSPPSGFVVLETCCACAAAAAAALALQLLAFSLPGASVSISMPSCLLWALSELLLLLLMMMSCREWSGGVPSSCQLPPPLAILYKYITC